MDFFHNIIRKIIFCWANISSQLDCGGVTKEPAKGNKFTLRKGKAPQKAKAGETSWIKGKGPARKGPKPPQLAIYGRWEQFPGKYYRIAIGGAGIFAITKKHTIHEWKGK